MQREGRGGRDGGFTLLETIVSLAMISTVTAGLTMFYLQSARTSTLQSQAQLANQLASTTLEQVSLLPGDSLVSGRPACAVAQQWASSAPGTATYLAGMSPVSDPHLASVPCPTTPSATTALINSQALPTTRTTAVPVNRGSLALTQEIYIGECWQTLRGACTRPIGSVPPAGCMLMLRVVVAITWPSPACADHVCAVIADTLVSQRVADLTFQLPP